MSREPTPIDIAVEPFGELQEPSIDEYGIYNGIPFKRYRGRFVGRTGRGEFDVRYEIVAPPLSRTSRPARELPGWGTGILELGHYHVGLPGRTDELFEAGYGHCGLGYGHLGKRSLDFSVIAGQERPLPDPLDFEYWKQFDDADIGAAFARALRRRPLGLPFERVYGLGISDSANALNRILAGPWSEGLFELSLPLIATSRLTERERLPGRGKVVLFNAEWDWVPFDGDPGDDYRVYDAAGGPHITNTGNTPIDWLIFLPALFQAGDAWAREGVEPPPSQQLELSSVGVADDPIARDEMGNALGGIRHSALVTREARFIARGAEGFFGKVDHVKAIGKRGFYRTWDEYMRAFKSATEALMDIGLLLEKDARILVESIDRGLTFTQSYFAKVSPRETREEPLLAEVV